MFGGEILNAGRRQLSLIHRKCTHTGSVYVACLTQQVVVAVCCGWCHAVLKLHPTHEKSENYRGVLVTKGAFHANFVLSAPEFVFC